MRAVIRTALAVTSLAVAVGVLFDYNAFGFDVQLLASRHRSMAGLIAVYAILICLVTALFRRFYTSPVRVMELGSMIHREAVRLSASSCTKFRLPDGDKRIAYLLINVKSNVATIRCVTWSEYSGHAPPRYLIVGPSGQPLLRSRDVAWRYFFLGLRLEGLVRFLRSCEPYSDVDQERVRRARSESRKSS